MMDIGGLATATLEEQSALDAKVSKGYSLVQAAQASQEVEGELSLQRKLHTKYLYGGLGELPGGFVSLDASRPWICYWVLHSLALLEAPLPGQPGCPESCPSDSEVVSFLASCQHPDGGFGGGPGQLAHLAPTYAAVCALVTLGTEEALSAIDRQAMWSFLQRMAVPRERGGGFTVHEGGEVDIRGSFTALAVAHMLCLDVQRLGELADAVGHLRRCQTFEGGLAGEPGNEAHGGYAFCGVAAAALLRRLDMLDLRRLLRWAAACQGTMEGGFMGRTNKLVDGCYSWWQGGVFPILHGHLGLLLGQFAGAPEAGALLVARPDASLYTGNVAVKALPPLEHALQAASSLQEEAHRLMAKADEEELAASKLEEETGVMAVEAQQAARKLHARGREAAGAGGRAMELARHLQSSAVAMFCSSSSSAADSQECGLATSRGSEDTPAPLFNSEALQAWVLVHCQVPSAGGLRDKPGKHPDYYHSCYCLSGLSAAQHCPGARLLGPAGNRLGQADPLVNVVSDKLQRARQHFASLMD